MDEYKWRNIALTPGMAATLASHILRSSNRPLVKKDITRQVVELHLSRGGLRPNSDQERILNKGLPGLCSSGEIERVGGGYYRSLEPKTDRESEAEPLEDDIEVAVAELDLHPEQTVGEGPESVYVYFSASERELAGFKKKEIWPCKVGFARGSVSSRVLAQGIKTAMAAFPIIGLVIKTDDAATLERVLHANLTEADAWIEDAPGSEWFMTSPRRILSWFSLYQDCIQALSTDS